MAFAFPAPFTRPELFRPWQGGLHPLSPVPREQCFLPTSLTTIHVPRCAYVIRLSTRLAVPIAARGTLSIVYSALSSLERVFASPPRSLFAPHGHSCCDSEQQPPRAIQVTSPCLSINRLYPDMNAHDTTQTLCHLKSFILLLGVYPLCSCVYPCNVADLSSTCIRRLW